MMIVLSACEYQGKHQSVEAKKVVEDMLWVENTTVDSMIARNIDSKPRFLAVELDGNVKIPGLPKNLCEQVVESKEYELLEGMSEIVYNNEHAQLRVKTREFAENYNKRLKQLLSDNNHFSSAQAHSSYMK